MNPQSNFGIVGQYQRPSSRRRKKRSTTNPRMLLPGQRRGREAKAGPAGPMSLRNMVNFRPSVLGTFTTPASTAPGPASTAPASSAPAAPPPSSSQDRLDINRLKETDRKFRLQLDTLREQVGKLMSQEGGGRDSKASVESLREEALQLQEDFAKFHTRLGQHFCVTATAIRDAPVFRAKAADPVAAAGIKKGERVRLLYPVEPDGWVRALRLFRSTGAVLALWTKFGNMKDFTFST